MKCYKCKREFSVMIRIIDAGKTWTLFDCPYCSWVQIVGYNIPQKYVSDCLDGKISIHCLPIKDRGEPRTDLELLKLKATLA